MEFTGFDIRNFGKAWTRPDFEVIFGHAVIWFSLYLAVGCVLKKTLSQFPHDKRMEFANRIVATCNSVYILTFAIVDWMDSPMLWQPNSAGKISYTKPPTAVAEWGIKAMCGYIVYDFAICLFVETELSLMFLFHHVIGLTSHLLILGYNDGLSSKYTTMGVYLAEGSTPFFHVAWMLNELRSQPPPQGETFRKGLWDVGFTACSGLLLLLFFLLRFLLTPAVLGHYYLLGSPALQASRRMPDEVIVVQVAIMMFFAMMNMKWFTDLFMLAVRHFGGGGKVKEA
ncbi:hypothetical protein DIPPA_31846 [Diplonema papillatum]|nr:hypothetical protein DIPPA_31846 [Diplonema papillatum]